MMGNTPNMKLILPKLRTETAMQLDTTLVIMVIIKLYTGLSFTGKTSIKGKSIKGIKRKLRLKFYEKLSLKCITPYLNMVLN